MSSLKSPILDKLSEDVQEYIELQLAYQKLQLFEKGASVASIAVLAIVVMLVLFFTIIAFVLFGAAAISLLTGNVLLGFIIVFFLCIFVLVLMFALFGYFKNKLFNLFLGVFLGKLPSDDFDFDFERRCP